MPIPMTENYLLYEPGLGNSADIRVLNKNTEKIDNGMYQNRRMIGDAYDPNSTAETAYMTDDLVVKQTTTYDSGGEESYSFEYYRCLADNVYGLWDPTKWELTDIATELQRRSGGGGASAFADLTDVSITSPEDGQIPRFNSTSQKWENEDLPDASVTKTAEGNPVTFADGADAPLVECVTEIQGSQDLHGYDKPWVGGSGKNILPPLTNGTYTSNGLTATVTDNSITVTGQFTTAQATWVDIPFVSAVTIPSGYYLHIRNSEIHNNTVLDFDSQANILLNVQNRIVSISALTSCTKIRFFCNINATEQFNLTMQLSIEQTDSVTDWTPYSNICPITAYTEGKIEITDEDGNTTTHTTTYPSAIYRGSEDCVNVEVTEEWKVIDLGDLTWTYASSSSQFRSSRIADIEEPADLTTMPNAICENYETITYQNISSADSAFTVIFASSNDHGKIYVKDSRYTDATAFTSAVSGVKLAYKLATPTTSSVTPTNLPIKSLSGYNHIESSTGDIDIEYITEEYQPIVDLIESNKHVYSTAEQIVGTWIDGKTVYEKTVTGSFSNASTARTWHDILSTAEVSELALDKFFISSGSYIIDPDGDIYTVPQTTGVSTGSAVGAIISGGKLQMVIEGMGSGTVEYALTIRYTKATAQTRSLSSGSLNLSKGEISGEKKKVDEEPIEEKNDVENDLEDWLEESEEVTDEDDGLEEEPDAEEVDEQEEMR